MTLTSDTPPDFEDRCPSCNSPAPHMHPAMAFEGEVETCPDEFHLRPTPPNKPEYIANVHAKRELLGLPKAAGSAAAFALLSLVSAKMEKWPMEARNAAGYPIDLAQVIYEMPPELKTFEAVMYDYRDGVKRVVERATVKLHGDKPMEVIRGDES